MPKTANKPAGNDKYAMKTMIPLTATDGMPALNWVFSAVIKEKNRCNSEIAAEDQYVKINVDPE